MPYPSALLPHSFSLILHPSFFVPYLYSLNHQHPLSYLIPSHLHLTSSLTPHFLSHPTPNPHPSSHIPHPKSTSHMIHPAPLTPCPLPLIHHPSFLNPPLSDSHTLFPPFPNLPYSSSRIYCINPHPSFFIPHVSCLIPHALSLIPNLLFLISCPSPLSHTLF